jgi:hypothetical protein
MAQCLIFRLGAIAEGGGPEFRGIAFSEARTKSDGGQEARRDARKTGAPGIAASRNFGKIADGPMTHEPENVNVHVRLSGNPAILGL